MNSPKQVNMFQAIRKGKWRLLAFLLIGLVAGALAVWRQPYIYQARVLLELEDLNQNLLNSRDVNPNAPMDNSSEMYINTEAQILHSTPVLERVADQLNRTGQPGGGAWSPPVTLAELSRAVRVRTHETDRILELTADSQDPSRAAAIANSITTQFVRQDLDSRLEASRQTSAWLASQLDDLGNKLRQSEQNLENFTRRENLLIDGSAAGVDDTGLREVQAELSRAQADRIAKESSLEQLQKTQQASAAPLIQDQTLQQYEVELTGLRKQLADLEETFTPDYYKIPALKAQIAAVEKAYDTQRKAVLEQKSNEFLAAQGRESLLQNRYDSEFKTATDQTAKMVEYSSLKNAVDLNRQIYSEILQKVKSYSVATAMQTSNVRVVESAGVPIFPDRPDKPLIAGLSSLGFLFVGIVWVVSRAASDTSIQEPGEAELFMQSPELGVIPSASARSRYSNGRGQRWISRSGTSLELAAWDQNLSLVAESFRSATASLLLPSPDLGVILITSLNPSDGKTTVASNLAIAMAAASRRVLLIDADRRRARLHSVFGRSNAHGLSDLLEAETPRNVSDLIADTRVPNLFLLPAGNSKQPSTEVLYSDKMASIVAQCRRTFDLIVIDTPPVLHLPDARIIGRLADGVILVLRAGRVRSETVAATEERLRRDGVSVVGTILNDWNPKANGYGVYPKAYR